MLLGLGLEPASQSAAPAAAAYPNRLVRCRMDMEVLANDHVRADLGSFGPFGMYSSHNSSHNFHCRPYGNSEV